MANNAPHPPVTLLMTRPRAAAERFVEEMPADIRAQFHPVFSPLIDITPVPGQGNINMNEAAIFTSRNGVAHGPDGGGRTAYCVGQATTAYAQSRGWQAQFAGHDADELVAHVSGTAPAQTLVHIRGQHTRGAISKRLDAAGHAVRAIIVYDQVLKPLTQQAQQALTGKTATIVPLFSPRTALQFAKVAPNAKGVHVIALSQAVADAVAPVAVDQVCDTPDAQAMYDALKRAMTSG